jgi:hypothetical protein
MFTSIDKALVAVVMGMVYVANTLIGTSIGLDEKTVAMIVGAATPILVWIVPNKLKK